MNKPKYTRKLSNVRYTIPFNVRYLGLWVTITLFLIVLINVLFYMLIRQFWGQDINGEATDFELVHKGYLVLLAIMTLIEAIGIVVFAIMTTHRIAGPWIQVKRVLEAVRDGNLEARLHFRQYDGLDHVAVAFNEMMDKVNTQYRENAAKK